MGTYHYSRTNSKGTQVKKVAIGLFVVSLVACGGVGVNAYLKNNKIDEMRDQITAIEVQKQELNTKVETLEIETKGLEEQIKKIEEGLWRFEPIIIPDSMK